MLRQVLEFLSPKAHAPRPVPPGDVAVAALLLRAARADGQEDPRQMAAVLPCLKRRYGLSDENAQELRDKAAALEAEIGDTVHLTRLVKTEVALDDRPALLEEMWQIILADGQRHENEDGLMRLVSNLLGLTDRNSAEARQAATSRLRPAPAEGT